MNGRTYVVLEPNPVGSANFLIWVLIFDIHNMTSPLPTVEQITQVMDEHGTNPLIAYYMIEHKLGYEDAVRYYQAHNKPLYPEDHFVLACYEDDGAHEIAELRHVTGLPRNVAKLLVEVEFDFRVFYPAEGEAERMYPDSEYEELRFMFGWSEEKADAEFSRKCELQMEQDRHREEVERIHAKYDA